MKNQNIGHLTTVNSGHPHRIEIFNVGYDLIGGIIPEDYQTKIKNFLNEIKDNKLTDNSAVYITPLSELPSYKLKNYIEENKLNITTARKLEKLDTLIINKEFIENNYLNITVWDSLTRTYLTNHITDYLVFPIDVLTKDPKFKKHINPMKNKWNDITIKGKKHITHYCVSMDEYNIICTKIPYFQTIKDKATIHRGIRLEGSHGSKKAFDSLEFYINLLDNVKKHNLKVVFDSNVNEDINKGLIIDFDIFQNLYGMLKSTDTGNWEVAKEIIANCEFEASKPYIIALYNMFMDLRKTSPNKNYNLVKKVLDTKKLGIKIQYRGYIPAFESLLSHFSTKCPELIPQLMPCLIYRINDLAKKEVIKEIILA
jgi:hypothetical protein